MSVNQRRKREEEEYDIVTLEDIIESTDEILESAAALLGASDSSNCSYDKGYVKRQALYSCKTCNPVGSPGYTRAGVCLACSLKCHGGHDLIELYTKRNFRCDCGNSKFPGKNCALQPNKDFVNDTNTYNQNFDGVYCVCSRPYPDPEDEDEDEDEMIQCVICEDWLHGRHSQNDNVDLESDVDNAEFVCHSCMKANTFLSHYASLQLGGKSNAESETVTTGAEIPSDVVDEAAAGDENPSACTKHQDSGMTNSDCILSTNSDKFLPDASFPVPSSKLGTVTVAEDPSSQDTLDSGVGSSSSDPTDMESEPTPLNEPVAGTCLLMSSFQEKASVSGGIWWEDGWREKLCQCTTCKDMYEKSGLQFLLDPEDPLACYEAKGKANGAAALEKNFIEAALSKLGRVQQIEVIQGFNEMKDALRIFLNKIGENGRVITPDDIKTFFSELRANKRRRVEDVNIPDNCR